MGFAEGKSQATKGTRLSIQVRDKGDVTRQPIYLCDDERSA
jgi:hypothetical protein